MKKTIVCCDLCGQEGAKDIAFFSGRFSEPTGSSEDHFEHIDLCPSHIEFSLRLLAGSITGEQGKIIYAKIMSAANKMGAK